MYYRPFDRSMGLWIINEFLKPVKITSTTIAVSGMHKGMVELVPREERASLG